MPIRTAHNHFARLGAHLGRHASEKEIRELWRAHCLEALGKEPTETSSTLVAYVNHGRWVADCLCRGGILCAPDMEDACCLDCGSVYKVTFPTRKKREAIEHSLSRRPDVQLMNWYPHESPDDLERQTRALRERGIA